ncbi:putative Prolyl 4-hydroxylase alpha subunit Fe(2+) 2OG dioxygenase domain-containing protein [Seiridium unicorne]|uniref:Prolyl 4-hydroxylase alpha subunit Fe(2+) 2OG dioxygenase domain-containing protein n=1 Tax=Seiridium unicorne TaxID=138068 RepID=A0ABR2UG75_9PEZI
MPYLRADAPESTPESETIESLLGERNSKTQTNPLQGLTEKERRRKGLVKLRMSSGAIPGDPFGFYQAWAGNVGHSSDKRMVEVMGSIYKDLEHCSIIESHEISLIRRFLTNVTKMDLDDLVYAFATHGSYRTIKNTAKEKVVTFQLGSNRVRLMQAFDLDVKDKHSYATSSRAIAAVEMIRDRFDEPPMTINEVRYVMLRLLQQDRDVGVPSWKSKGRKVDMYHDLKDAAREEFWLNMTLSDRNLARKRAREISVQGRSAGANCSAETKKLWKQIKNKWASGWCKGLDKDLFYQYFLDQRAAHDEDIWEAVDEDIFIVLDKNRRVVLANIERLTQLLYGTETADILVRCLDLWSHYVPMPIPDTARHVVENHHRRVYSWLDPSRATVETLPNAKMTIAHYGCWASRFDLQGENILRTSDTRLQKIPADDRANVEKILPGFCTQVLGKVSEIIRFLYEPLDPDMYRECREIYQHLPEDAKIKMTEDDFISLLVVGINGYTQRHRDGGDLKGGFAGLVSLGDYKGGNFCIPALGVKVPYQPGVGLVIRGTELEHLTQDHAGFRAFVVGTIHETCRKHARRKMGLGTAPCPEKEAEDENYESEEGRIKLYLAHKPGASAEVATVAHVRGPSSKRIVSQHADDTMNRPSLDIEKECLTRDMFKLRP